ncbi:MAG TPA: MarR family transcriptional regulator [Polyangiales bacterium]|nr:MarR family transcriptional regulator [Polyangiales bacterium]
MPTRNPRATPAAQEAAALPLARLMAMAFRTLIDELHAHLARRGWQDVRPAYGYVLLAGRDGSITVTEVAALLGMTKQAASKLVEGMVQEGYLRRGDNPDDARSKQLKLSAKGARLLAVVESIYAEIEAEWAAIIGAPALERMRADLTRVLRGLHDGGLPAIRPTW